jgi:hypothetical protein
MGHVRKSAFRVKRPMKKLLVVLSLLSSMAVAQQMSQTEAPPQGSSTQSAPATGGASQAIPVDPAAKKARAEVDLMVKTLGGQAYLTYQTKTEEGRTYSFYQGTPRGAGTLFWRFWKYPDKDRTELTKQRDIAYLITGDSGYEITFKGTALQEADALADYLRRRDHSLEVVSREWLKDPQTIVLPAGSGVAEQKLCDLVTIVTPKNDSVTIAIDQITHLPVQKTFTYRDKDKYKVEESEIFANYREQQGIMTPFTWTRKKDGLMTSQRFITKIDYNVAIPDAKFDAKVNYDPHELQKEKKK